jgi:hypothetical protein
MSLDATDGTPINTFMGGCILIMTKTEEGEPAIVLRGFNPQLRLIRKASVMELFDTFLQYVIDKVAAPMGINTILAPFEMVSGGAFTNRPIVHLGFKARYRKSTCLKLDRNHGSTYNDRAINESCVIIWQAEKTVREAQL